MPACRVYLFTYDRNEMLKRAIASLIDQTFTDWVCELHNDLPGNTFPEEYVRSLGDDRFIIKTHPVNLGTTKSFNLAFAGCDEDYATMLEDDNWWEPTFLEEMIQIMEKDNGISVSWCNMHIWKENEDRTWQDTGKTIWPVNNDRFFTWPQPSQALGHLHSTGAMLYRGSKAAQYQIPPGSLSNAVEVIRERAFEHPIFLNSKVLANFSQTLVTSQTKDKIKWTGTLIMTVASYINSSSDPTATTKQLLEFYRARRPSPVAVFFLAVCFYLKKPSLLLNLNANDWYRTMRWCVGNIANIKPMAAYLKSQEATWNYLKTNTKQFESV